MSKRTIFLFQWTTWWILLYQWSCWISWLQVSGISGKEPAEVLSFRNEMQLLHQHQMRSSRNRDMPTYSDSTNTFRRLWLHIYIWRKFIPGCLIANIWSNKKGDQKHWSKKVKGKNMGSENTWSTFSSYSSNIWRKIWRSKG